MNILKKVMSLVLVLGLIFSLTSCSKQENTSQKAEQNNKSGNLKVIVTSDDYKPLFNKYTNETGTKVETLSMSSGEVISRVKAEGDKKMADVWFGGGIDAFMEAKSENLLTKVDFSDSSKIDKEFKDSDNHWFSKGVTVVGFIVNPKVLEEKGLEEPKTWDDLRKAEYKDAIIMSNPAVSGTNYAVLNGLIQVKGEEGWKYFEDLNNNIQFYSKRGKDPALKVSEGEFAIGITYIDKTLDTVIAEKGLKIIYPEDGMPWIPDGVAAFKGSDNEEEAKKFIEWVYKEENLKELMKLDQKNTLKLVVPSMKDVELDFDSSKLLKQDLKLFGGQREEMLEKWKTLIGDKGEE